MESFMAMNYTLKHSLKHMTIIKLGITLWSLHDVRILIEEYFSPETFFRVQTTLQDDVEVVEENSYLSETYFKGRGSWRVIEDKVIDKISKLPLPKSLEKEVYDVIEPLGLEIKEWMVFHQRFVSMTRLGGSCLCWKLQGTVDMKKTAEALVKNENLHITERYILACIYCLETDIKVLWNKLSETKKKSFYNRKNLGKINLPELVVIWTHYMKGEVAMPDNKMVEGGMGSECPSYLDSFTHAVISGNRIATEYFLQKLNPIIIEVNAENQIQLLTMFQSVIRPTDFSQRNYTDVLCFLLSQMDKRHQEKVLKNNFYQVLKSFLVWPWQSFFVEMAKHIFTFISETHYYFILRDIIYKLTAGYKDYNYQKLFEELWQQSPDNYKKYVIKEEHKELNKNVLFSFFKTEDRKNITLILNYSSCAEKENLIFSKTGIAICKYLIFRSNWNLVRLIVGECILSEKKIIKFKDIVLKQYYSSIQHTVNANTWKMFLNFLDDFIKA